MARDYNVIIVS